MEKQTENKTLNLGLVKALFDFQQACPAIKKDSTAQGTKFTYKYGGLPHIIEIIKPHLKKAGLVFTQTTDLLVNVEGGECLKTILYHVESGETLESTMYLPNIEFQQMNVVQSKGAIITYMRRYSLMSILGLVTEDDDTDAVGKTKSKTTSKPKADDKPWLNPKEGGNDSEKWLAAVKYLADGGTILEIKKKYRMSKANEEKMLNQAMTFDDLPFDRKDAEDNAGAGGDQVNMDFENQGPEPDDDPENY